MDCIFCKIRAGQVPCMKVYEDEHTLVIMDIAGDVDGHMLAIPKKHVDVFSIVTLTALTI